MIKYALVVVCFANGKPCPIAGQFVESMDFEAHDGRGFLVATRDATKALKFDSGGDALEFWRTQSATRPLRDDGHANRPLTATTCEIVKISEAN